MLAIKKIWAFVFHRSTWLRVIHLAWINKMIDDPRRPWQNNILRYRLKSDVIDFILYTMYIFSNFGLQFDK
jgi:hypothetical protein